MNYIKIIAGSIFLFILFSCHKDEEFNPLENTIWRHEFRESEHIVNAKAAEYHFGVENVAYYAIGQDGKISRRIGVYPYTVHKDELTIGATSVTITGNTFVIHQMVFTKKSN